MVVKLTKYNPADLKYNKQSPYSQKEVFSSVKNIE